MTVVRARAEVYGRLAVLAALVLALALWSWSLASMDDSKVGGLGFVSVLNPPAYAAFALVAVVFIWLLVAPRPKPVLLAASVLTAILILHGTALAVEPVPRFTTGYLHLGFVDYIARTGSTLPGLDARFSWPGAFAGGAVVRTLSGMPVGLPLIRWAPVVCQLLYAPAILALARALGAGWRGAWLAAFIFAATNWIGQDYFAPQAIAFLLYVVISTAVFRYLRRSGGEGAAEPATRISAYLLVIALFCAVVVSHQLTPVALILILAVLTASRDLRTPYLMPACALLFAGWLSFGARAFWVGHLRDIFGSVGAASTNVATNVNAHYHGTADRQFVLQTRILLTAAVCALAVIGVIRLWRASQPVVTIALCSFVPFAIVLLQSYGGESLLRAVLYASPFLAFLGSVGVMGADDSALKGAQASVRPTARRRLGYAVGAVASLAVMWCFFVARYGNEQFEAFSVDDARAVSWIYSHARHGAVLAGVSEDVPWRYRDLDSYRYQPLTDTFLSNPRTLRRLVADSPRGMYIVFSPAQDAYGVELKGLRPGWSLGVERAMIASGFHVVFARGHVRVLGVRSAAGAGRS
jgi:hypothetical protein